jgi:hypothetical protein
MKNKQLLKLALVKSAVNWSKDIQKEILTPEQRYPLSYLTGEADELVTAFKNLDKENIKEELQDVAYAAQMIPYQRLGINGPVFFADGSIQKFRDRRNVWRNIFKRHNTEFDNKYMTGGSNYKKPKKIVNALAAAGVNISEDDAIAALDELGIAAEDGTGYSSGERTAKLFPHVTKDPEFRKQELINKIKEYQTEQSEKALADIYMAKQWAELAGADISDVTGLPEKNDAALIKRLSQLETRLRDTGDLYAKK